MAQQRLSYILYVIPSRLLRPRIIYEMPTTTAFVRLLGASTYLCNSLKYCPAEPCKLDPTSQDRVIHKVRDRNYLVVPICCARQTVLCVSQWTSLFRTRPVICRQALSAVGKTSTSSTFLRRTLRFIDQAVSYGLSYEGLAKRFFALFRELYLQK